MDLKIAVFNKNGGAITGKVTNGWAQGGSYNFILWESDDKTVITRTNGNFLNNNAEFTLPAPNIINDGRLLECITVVAIIPPQNQYNVTFEILQDGKQLASLNQQGSVTTPTITCDQFIQLKGV